MISGIGSVGTQAGYVQGTSRPSAKEMFAQVDTNGDGSIDLSELEAMLEQGPPVRESRPAPPPRGTPPDAAQLIERFDSDGDGVLNEEEATALAESLRAEMETMAARFATESGRLELPESETDDQNTSAMFVRSALQTYAGDSTALAGSLFSTLG